MSIERRFMFGPGFAAEVFVVRDAFGQLQAVVDPATGRPVPVELSAIAFQDAFEHGLDANHPRTLVVEESWGRPAPARQAVEPERFARPVHPGFIDRAAFERAAYERAALERAAMERAAMERASFERTGFERSDVQRGGFDRSEVERGRMNGAPQAAPGQDEHRVRGHGTGVVRFELLGQIGAALAETLAANREVMDRATARDRRDTAEDLASAVLQTLGVELPNASWIPNTRESRTWGGQLRLGEELTRLPLPALVQLLLHEAGRVHEKKDATAARHLVNVLHVEGYLSKDEVEHLRASDDATAETYAALGAWIFAPAQRPAIGAVLDQLEAPEGSAPRDHRGTEARVAVLVRALDRARMDGAFEARFARHDGELRVLSRADADTRPTPWAFGDDS